jgi:alpha-glucosidase (family GH31 glycosyl hydrolase)
MAVLPVLSALASGSLCLADPGSGHALCLDPATGGFGLRSPSGEELLASAAARPGAAEGWHAFAVSAAEISAFQLFGIFQFTVRQEPWTGPARPPDRTDRLGGRIVTYFPLPEVGETLRLTLEAAGSGAFRVRLAPAIPDRWGRTALRLRLAPDESVFGLGSRTNACNQRGNRLQNWVEEGGNGKSDTPVFGVGNVPSSSHVPIPFLLSSRGYGLLAETARRTTWDVGRDDPGTLRLEADAPSLDITIFAGPAPADVLRRLTDRIGRPAIPPYWAMAPAEFGKGGTAEVRRKARVLREEGIPASALWFEDWVGLQHGPLPGLTHLPWGRWESDPAHYPDLASLNADLEAGGFKSLGYFNPFVQQGDPKAASLLATGGVLRKADGSVDWWPGPFGLLTQVDPTHPEAVRWMNARLGEFEAVGFDGAMVDFGEWTPHGARFHDGRTGRDLHNAYPDLWAQVHKEFWRRARPDGDYVFYTRSGYTAAARSATYMWAADQNTDWGRDDGFPTALTAILTAGLSGVPLMTHDIAGFATLGGRASTRELYYRWLAFGAFSTFMRTHSGQKPALNWHMERDAETLALHRRYARMHMALAPYRHAVVREAAETGMPAMRHLYLEFPADPRSRTIDDQYMLGPFLLVAPVFTEGATARDVYLPPGRWFAYQTGKPYPGGQSHRVPAAIEDIPVFVREGTVLPLLADGVMTLLPSVDPRVPGLAAARSTLKLACYLGPRTALRMADGAVLVNHPPAGWNGDGQVRTAKLASGPKAEYRAAVSAGAGKWEVAVLGAPRGLREVSAELR